MPKGAEQPEPEIDRRIRETETTLQVVRTRLEERGLEGSPRPLTLPEVQRSLDPDALLLVYSLGPDRSWLWEITSDRFETHELVKRSEIEEQAQAVNRLLSGNIHRDWRAWTPALEKLSRTLLSPVADRLGERQLLISPDGALYLTPFAALLDPLTLDRTGEPGGDPDSPRFLIFDHRLVTIPSISVVAATRDALSERLPAQKEIAILGAPDFTGTDLEPLPHSLKEAEAIARIASPGRSFLATGSQASRSTATDPELGKYRFLHFATHGRLGERPDLSGIALSFREGFLPAFEIYDFKLSADLVVLSACETAVGGERGGLVRAFLHAGSKRVMATLWKVPDRSTPQLMENFYRGLLSQGAAPSAALQQAQIEMLKTPWKAPYYWAGFMLQGEWRLNKNRRAVSHRGNRQWTAREGRSTPFTPGGDMAEAKPPVKQQDDEPNNPPNNSGTDSSLPTPRSRARDAARQGRLRRGSRVGHADCRSTVSCGTSRAPVFRSGSTKHGRADPVFQWDRCGERRISQASQILPDITRSKADPKVGKA